MYKRNQIEEAISKTLRDEDIPSVELRNRIKRVLDFDRTQAIQRSSDSRATNYAFYSSEKPGKGAESSFSGYEVFALAIALRLLEHGWPQAFAVNTLRAVRRRLEGFHRSSPWNQSLVWDNDRNSSFLLIVSDKNAATRDGVAYPKVFSSQREGWKFQMEKPGRSCSWFELDPIATSLRMNLN